MLARDSQAAKAAAAGRGSEILSALTGIPESVLDGRHHPCPKCEGTDRFRYDRAKEFAICSHCFNRKNGDIIAAVMHFGGYRFPEALARIASYLGLPIGNQNRTVHGTTDNVLEVVAKSKGVTADALKAYGAYISGGCVVIPAYSGEGKHCTEFRLRPGTGKSAKGLFSKGKPAGVFLPHENGVVRLPQPGETWLVVEGPKDAAAAWSLGYNAIGLPMCKLNQKFVALLREVNVILVFDRDFAGDLGAHQSAARLYRVAASIRVAVLPDELKPKDGADLRSFLRKPNGEHLVRQTIESAQTWLPAARSDERGRMENSDDILRDEVRTEIANGKRLIARFGSTMRWIPALDAWAIFTGERWQIGTSLEAEARAKDIAADLWRKIHALQMELAAADGPNAHQQIASLIRFGRSTSSAAGVRNMLSMARSEIGITISHNQFDADPFLLNVVNGSIDLRTGTLRPHDLHDYQSKLCPVPFDESAECPRWRTFMREITSGDVELERFMQRLVGYFLTGETREHILPFAFGQGANGKSVFVSVLQSLLGDDYAMQAAPELLMSRSAESHPTERADLYRKRLVITTEIEANRRLNESLVKDLTGGDRIRARRMRQDFWEFTPTHKVLMMGNHKPQIAGTDNGIWRRLKLIPFSRTFAAPDQDKELLKKLLVELPGILKWAVDGCVEWQSQGLGEPGVIRLATAEYRTSQDTISAFIAECCNQGPNEKIRARDLLECYHEWATRNGEIPAGSRSFFEEVASRYPKSMSNGTWYRGISIRS